MITVSLKAPRTYELSKILLNEIWSEGKEHYENNKNMSSKKMSVIILFINFYSI